ncbi:MAG: DEAD/DEAH box helicase [Alphaproteobacteria bacterium]
MTTTSFTALGLSERLCATLEAAGHQTPTPVQAEAIPPLLAGRDLLGIAQTGTGKTAAFLLPILAGRLAAGDRPAKGGARALILTPTRELAAQVAAAFDLYAKGTRLNRAVVVGGVPQGPQVKSLARGVDVLVATPGRLLDLVDQRRCDLATVETLVLDEADRMLDLGFREPIRRIAGRVAPDRRTALFSATMAPAIERLAGELLHDPVRVEVKAKTVAVERIAQHVHFLAQPAKRDFVLDLLADPDLSRVILFTRTKHGAERLAAHLSRADVAADAIHGDKTQKARDRALAGFRRGHTRVLVATDVAARGIDVPEVSHVINFDLPQDAETYVHRIGRTGRAGRDGVAVSFCAPDERDRLRDIERLTGLDLGAGPARRAGPKPANRNRRRPRRDRPAA